MSFFHKKIHLCRRRNHDLYVKDVNTSEAFNRKNIMKNPPTKATNSNNNTLLHSKSCIYENADLLF